MIRAWRLVKGSYAPGAFSGEGARRFGSRWTSPGVTATYAAESLSLATLEVLVHLGSSAPLAAYVSIPIDFPEGIVETVDKRKLPRGWRTDPAPAAARALGDKWIEAGERAVLKLPSVVIPQEHIFLINPRHPDFAKAKPGCPTAFVPDERLP